MKKKRNQKNSKRQKKIKISLKPKEEPNLLHLRKKEKNQRNHYLMCLNQKSQKLKNIQLQWETNIQLKELLKKYLKNLCFLNKKMNQISKRLVMKENSLRQIFFHLKLSSLSLQHLKKELLNNNSHKNKGNNLKKQKKK